MNLDAVNVNRLVEYETHYCKKHGLNFKTVLHSTQWLGPTLTF